MTSKFHTLEQMISDFVNDHLDPSQPVLLGLSGGPDSLALFYLLTDYMKRVKNQLRLGIAHIDHGWRKESTQEALELKQLTESFNLPFHLKTLSPLQMTGNLEAACRQQRLLFFSQLCEKYHYQAVILGHHADDNAETVLKRVLEGAGITSLSGLKPKTSLDGVTVWRPLLNVSKITILSWLSEKSLAAFQDATNLDSKFLRGRFRTEIFPQLSQSFGKEVSTNLCHLGVEVQELTEYLQSHLKHYFEQVIYSPIGVMLDLSVETPPLFAIKFLLREICRQEGFSLSRNILDTASEMIISKMANRSFEIGAKKIYVDRGRLFVMRSPKPDLPEKISLQFGISQYGPWRVDVRPFSSQKGTSELRKGWRSLLEGSVSIALPEGSYSIGRAKLSAPYPGERSPISKWWTNEKAPSFLREYVPVIWLKEQIVHEFLTCRPWPLVYGGTPHVEITLSWSEENDPKSPPKVYMFPR